jgi:hypothetical protein
VNVPHIVLTAEDALTGHFLRVKHLFFSVGLPLDIVLDLLGFFVGLPKKQFMKLALGKRGRNNAFAFERGNLDRFFAGFVVVICPRSERVQWESGNRSSDDPESRLSVSIGILTS